MLQIIKSLLKKNFYIYIFSRFLYVKIYVKIVEKFNIIKSSQLNKKQNNFFKDNPKEIGEVLFYDQIFFYPKRSTYLKKFLKNFENDKTKKTYETLKRDFFDMNRINCVLDIGANIGYQSLFYNNFFLSNTKIVCFEPHPISYFFLEKNLSKFNNIILYNFALGNKEGKEIISIPEHESHEANNLGIARISKSFTNYLKAEIIVKKFDELKILNDDYQSIFIKIDVEGYEKNVLLGMKNFLKKKKNLFLKIEVNKNYHNYSELKYIIDFLFSLNFSFFILDNNKLVKLNKVEIFKFSLYRNVEIYCKKNSF